MLLPSSLTRTALMLAGLSLALSACDSGAEAPGQEQAGLGGEKANLLGEIDPSYAGELMPAINVADPDGKQLNLGALQGRPVLLNLWATWCAPCKVEMPMLNELAKENEALKVLTVSQDFTALEEVPAFLMENDLDQLEPWLDPDGKVAIAVGSSVLPTTILYDESGVEVWRVVGDYDWSSAETQEAIAVVLAE
ncbi:TlpA disulfide reductase family protein [Pontixanthobacter sp. CEM42]|uniref:TlpA family protein disulfide reductase n=1 Tax=Pontixanthobacter sp. CEM42 TaxID=2792077 RepID=UPI001FD7DB51|nr:TlpA disulfide reductase family protein [Pontixanthobacter sp. CEM42]